MQLSKFWLVAASVVVGAVMPAQAGDWQGLYLGVQGGYGWGTDSLRTTLQNNGVPLVPVYTNDFEVDGFAGGVQAGANAQIDQLVLGVEGRYSRGNIAGEFGFDPKRPEAVAGGELEWLASLSGRVGLDLDGTLLFARAGYAMTAINGYANNVFDPAPAEDVATGGESLPGYVLGVGVEQALGDQVSIGLDYSRYVFARGDFDMISPAYPDGVVLRTEPALELNVISASVNVHF